MPTITVQGPPITDVDVKRGFVKALTDAAEAAYGIHRDAYVVLLKENTPDNVGVGGELLVDRHSSGT
ncbi:MAG: tautomerase family protein [Armatimonadota bacterium]|jgi:4-oxalocrotonate tautomerase